MTKRDRWPLTIKIVRGNPYGIPVGKILHYARLKEGDASPYLVDVFPQYQFKIKEVEIL